MFTRENQQRSTNGSKSSLARFDSSSSQFLLGSVDFPGDCSHPPKARSVDPFFVSICFVSAIFLASFYLWPCFIFFFIVALFLFVVLCIDTVVSSNCLYICRPFYCTDRARAALYSLTNKVSEFDHWKSITTKQVFNQVYWMIAYHCASNLNIICIICLLRTLITRLTILTRFITLVLFALKITFCTLYQTNNFY